MVITDTSVLSLAIRRPRPELLNAIEQKIVRELLELSDRGDASPDSSAHAVRF